MMWTSVVDPFNDYPLFDPAISDIAPLTSKDFIPNMELRERSLNDWEITGYMHSPASNSQFDTMKRDNMDVHLSIATL